MVSMGMISVSMVSMVGKMRRKRVIHVSVVSMMWEMRERVITVSMVSMAVMSAVPMMWEWELWPVPVSFSGRFLGSIEEAITVRSPAAERRDELD